MANQSAKASTGQQYGKATEQLESQEMIPLPQNVEPSVRPGSAGPLLRPTEFPNQPISAPMSDNPIADRDSGDDYSLKVARIMPQLLEAASKPTSSASTRNIVNQWKAMVTPLNGDGQF